MRVLWTYVRAAEAPCKTGLISDSPAASVPERVREACAWVATRSRFVRIEEGALAAYAATLPRRAQAHPLDPETYVLDGSRERRASFVICLDAINFGSGWWPTIRKRAGHSGYHTIAAGMAERFRTAGAFAASELVDLSPAAIALILGQDAAHPLMADFAAALRDVGAHVLEDYGGSFATLVDSARGSAPELAGTLARWTAFADTSRYGGREVPFFKRAQIAAADVHLARVATLARRDRLTAFADNLVPHVLRVDGVLTLDEPFIEQIERGELLEHASPREVELRACAVHAIELLSDLTARRLAPAEIDQALWTRGALARYKALPRPRCRTTAY